MSSYFFQRFRFARVVNQQIVNKRYLQQMQLVTIQNILANFCIIIVLFFKSKSIYKHILPSN